MPWYSPPTRREISLIFFSLTVFVLFYNLESSFTSSPLSGKWPTSQANSKGAGAKKDWDDVIYGDWTWEEVQVAENAQKQALDKPKFAVAASFRPQVFGSVGVNDGILDWGDDVPTTTVLKHVPGAWRVSIYFVRCLGVA